MACQLWRLVAGRRHPPTSSADPAAVTAGQPATRNDANG
jgi:hypothetical protein